MPRRLGALCFPLSLSLSILFAAAPAFGQVPANIKQTNDVTAARPALEEAIRGNVQRLVTGDSEQQPKARLAIMADTVVNGQPAAPAYLDAYAQILNRELISAAANPSPNVRLNAAIVAEGVAKVADNAQLAPAVKVFLSDKSDAVVLWGVKAARWVIPPMLRGLVDSSVADAVVQAVQAHHEGFVGGAIAGEAYNAVCLDLFNKNITGKMRTATLPHVLKLLAFRVDLYKQGVPPEPRAENTATSYLANPAVWGLQNPQQMLTSMQLMLNLLSLAGQQAEKANAGDLADLAGMISLAGRAMSVIFAGAGADIANALEAVGKVDKRTPAADIKKRVDGAVNAILTSGKFPNLQPPPTIQSAIPAPAPAQAPTSGPSVLPGSTPAAPGTGTTPGSSPPGGTPGATPRPTPGGTPGSPPGAAPRTPPLAPPATPPRTPPPVNRSGR